jgi:Transposase DDE domain group 1
VAEGNRLPIEFPGFRGRKIQADFSGGEVSGDGGILAVRQVDRWLGLTKRLGQVLPDRRDPDRITHSLESLLQQRLYGLALGYEDRERPRRPAPGPAVANGGRARGAAGQQRHLVPVGKPGRPTRSLADASGALRTICRPF